MVTIWPWLVRCIGWPGCTTSLGCCCCCWRCCCCCCCWYCNPGCCIIGCCWICLPVAACGDCAAATDGWPGPPQGTTRGFEDVDAVGA